MRLIILICILLSALSNSDSAIFETYEFTTLGKGNAASDLYLRTNSRPGVKGVKLIAIREEALESKQQALGISDKNDGNDNFSIEKGSGNHWVGRGQTNFDRFTIRKINGYFSGQILYKGRMLVLVPILTGVSMLYEVDLSESKCNLPKQAAFKRGESNHE
jgi:hypothetical protein